MNKPLPRAIQRQLEEAEELQRQLSGQSAPPVEEPQAQTVEATPEPAPQPEPPKPVEDDAAKWQQRYRTLQGEFNSKVPKLQEQVKDLTAKLETTLARLEAVKVEPPKLITEKDAEEFGADMLDLIDRKVRQELDAIRAPLLDKIEQLEQELSKASQAVGDVSQMQVDAATERFFGRLGQLVPNYADVNVDPNWLAWLAEEDPVSGMPRQEALDAAAKNLNADRVAAIFKAYSREAAAAQPAQPANDTLSRQVAPARNAAAVQSQSQPQGRVYSGAEVQAAFDHRMRSRMTPQDYKALIDDVNLAISQGRVVP